LVDVVSLREIATREYADIVIGTLTPGANELRIFLRDGSFVDVWFSLKLTGRRSYHWERQAIDGSVYRHDNAPHQRWQAVSTFPDHFHDGSEDRVAESHLSPIPEDALRQFLSFIRGRMAAASAKP
jgi:hypothetical protein